MWDMVNTPVGWDHLTPGGIRLGFASFLALRVMAPGQNSFSELVLGIIFSNRRWLINTAQGTIGQAAPG
jgi:hypothetical protein